MKPSLRFDTRRQLLKMAAGAAVVGAAPLASAMSARSEQERAVFRTIHRFSRSTDPSAGGASPASPPALMSDGLLWGTTNEGGELGFGTIYAMTARGQVRTMHSFIGRRSGFGSDTSAGPGHRLLEGADGALWGTVFSGGLGQGDGSTGHGSIYRYERGGQFQTVYQFGQAGATGRNPEAGLIQASDGNFYGSTGFGGVNGNGTLFRLTPQGEVTDMHLFLRGANDGARINAELLQASDGGLWGVTPFGGAADAGVVFRLGLDGQYTVVHHFGGGLEGSSPSSPLVQGADGALYGSCRSGGERGAGTIYRISLNGDYTELYSFSGGSPRVGKVPVGSLVAAADGWLYGVTLVGGRHGTGCIFRLHPSGEMQVLHAFDADEQVVYKSGLSQGADGQLYGTVDGAVKSNAGAVFALFARAR